MTHRAAEKIAASARVIGKPVSQPAICRREKYKYIWDAVADLKKGDWLPVECADEASARRVAMSAYGHRTMKLNARQVKNTVFLRQREKE